MSEDKMGKFNDQLHEDLFGLFIAEYFFWHHTVTQSGWELYQSVRELFPLENMPEQYERYISASARYELWADYGIFCYPSKDCITPIKVLITVVEE